MTTRTRSDVHPVCGSARRRWLTSLLCGTTVAALPLPAEALLDDAVPPHEPGVDPRIRPGDDFFAYANGEWLARTTPPAGPTRWTARHEIDALTRERLDALVAVADAAPAGTAERAWADFRAAWLDEAAIEARGLRPAQPLLDRIAGLDSKAALARHLGRQLRADVDPLNWGVYSSPNLFGLAVQRGARGERGHFAYLLQGGLGLPERELYLADSERAQRLQQAYRDHVARLLALAGFARAEPRADAVLALETALARVHADEAVSSDEHNADHHWTLADFQTRAPGIDWRAFFTAAGLPAAQGLVAWQPDAITGQAALVASQPLAVWRDHLRVRLLDQHAALLPRAFATQAAAFREVELGGQPQPLPRVRRAAEAATQALPDAIGRLYVERHFPPEQKARVQAIAADVIAAFTRRVEAVPWLAPATRAQALAKLKVAHFGLGYPETWTDYAGLRVDRTDAWGNAQRAAEWHTRRALARLKEPADRTEWVMAPQTVAAVFLPLANAYNFPAALLQPPKFDPAASDAANYGAIGAIVGHEVSHFVDTLGAGYDANGALNPWWTAEDRARYEGLAGALSRQFADYRPLPGQAIDGPRTQSENVADLGGLAAALDAWHATAASRAADAALRRRQDRQFFIGFARSWRSAAGDAALQAQLAKDTHAPERWRVATVRNLDAWYEAFDVRPGQALYLVPAERLRVW